MSTTITCFTCNASFPATTENTEDIIDQKPEGWEVIYDNTDRYICCPDHTFPRKEPNLFFQVYDPVRNTTASFATPGHAREVIQAIQERDGTKRWRDVWVITTDDDGNVLNSWPMGYGDTD